MLELDAPTDSAPAGQVLLIDDEQQVLNAYARVLRAQGFGVVTLPNGALVENVLAELTFDVVVCDIRMPGASGIDILRAVRARDPDLPVILMTAGGDLTSAVEAVEHGALRYLLKPIAPSLLGQSAADAIRLRRLALTQRRAFELFGSAAVEESAELELAARFERALDTLRLEYQPIVRWADRSVFAYEALARSAEPALAAPDALFNAAEKLGRLFDVGRRVRRAAAASIQDGNVSCLFVNLHPRDLEDDDLLSHAAPLSRFAARVVLEVTERASLTDIAHLRVRLASLRRMGYRLAVDDLGAGYAGLTWFSQLEPEVVKLDMALTRAIDREPTKQKLVASIARLCSDLGMRVVGEGVETAAERDALVAAGCELLQGFHFARPAASYPNPRF
jgi:EAL domain-containing protein (putative c-di-GMP-specific phosphodiesterase class I)/AmiR/NasT family two-component response regulator